MTVSPVIIALCADKSKLETLQNMDCWCLFFVDGTVYQLNLRDSMNHHMNASLLHTNMTNKFFFLSEELIVLLDA